MSKRYLIGVAVSALILTAACSAPQSGDETAAPETPSAQGEASPEFISPTQEPIRVGYAGQDPANIGRYLMARGAAAVNLSPNGEAVSYISSVTGLRQVWIMDSSGGQPRQLTYGNGVTFHTWTPDGSAIVYGADNDGNEQESYYTITPDGSVETELLGVAEGGFRRFGGFAGNGETYAFASTERNGLDFDIYTAKPGETPQMVYQGVYGFYVEAVSQDGSQIVMSQTVGEDSDNLYLLDTATGARTDISIPDPRANHASGNIKFSADGKSLYFATNDSREFAALVRYDLETGRRTEIFAAEQDVEDIELCGPGADTLVFSTNHDGFSKLHALRLSTGQALKTPALNDGVFSVSCGSDTTKIAINVSAWDTPGDIFIWDSAGAEVSRVFKSDLAGLNPDRLIKPQSVRMTARDGVTLQGLLYLPDEGSAPAGKVPPVVFDVHGGPTAQSRPGFDGPAQYLVDRGIAVFKSNVRGSTGFGRTYSTLDDKTKRLDSVTDLVDMLADLDDKGLVDGENAAVLGGSYGGYAVNAVLAAYPGTFKAGVSLFGVADWVTALEVASPALKAADIIEYGDITTDEWRDFYTKNSPIRQADNINVPVLFSHGAMDPRIDIFETETMVRILRGNGVEAEFIRFEDEGHGWRKLSNRLFYHRREATFLEKHLLGE